MNKWIGISATVPVQELAPRHYFLKELATPGGVWLLRLAAIAIVILMIVLYHKAK